MNKESEIRDQSIYANRIALSSNGIRRVLNNLFNGGVNNNDPIIIQVIKITQGCITNIINGSGWIRFIGWDKDMINEFGLELEEKKYFDMIKPGTIIVLKNMQLISDYTDNKLNMLLTTKNFFILGKIDIPMSNTENEGIDLIEDIIFNDYQ